MKTIKTEQVGKIELRLVQTSDGFVGAMFGGQPVPQIHGDDPDMVWRKLRAEVGKASPNYFGQDGARARFLRLFPEGFEGDAFVREERQYKVDASTYLNGALPLDTALGATNADWEPAARAFSKTNMLSAFEQARTRDVLRGKDGGAFLQAAAALSMGDTAAALLEIEKLFKPHGQPSWPAATYLPFLWRPEEHLFLKPEVTKDFAERVGHRFAEAYEPRLRASVYAALLELARETREHLGVSQPRDMIDLQSFIWIVGAYPET